MESFVKLKAMADGVIVLTIDSKDDPQHRFNSATLKALHSALDEVEKDENATALVTTNTGKFYSNGFDLRLLQTDPDKFQFPTDAFHSLLDRVLCFPMPTVAAICGHAAAAGCMFTLAHDYRVMRRDKGFIFLNEAELGRHFTPGMMSLIRNKLPIATFHKAVLPAHKFTGKTAEEAGFVNGSFPDAHTTQEAAIKLATELGRKKYNRSVYKAIKSEMFRGELKDLRSGDYGPPGIILSKI